MLADPHWPLNCFASQKDSCRPDGEAELSTRDVASQVPTSGEFFPNEGILSRSKH